MKKLPLVRSCFNAIPLCVTGSQFCIEQRVETVSCHLDIEQTFQPTVTRPDLRVQTGGFLVKKEKSISIRERISRVGGERGGRRELLCNSPQLTQIGSHAMDICLTTSPVSCYDSTVNQTNVKLLTRVIL